MSDHIKIKLKPFEVVVKEFGYKRKLKNLKMWKSEKCMTQINDDMIYFFGTEIKVYNNGEGLYSYNIWTINDMWVEKDKFKISEIDNMFNIMLEEI